VKICFYVSRNATRLKKFLSYSEENKSHLLEYVDCIVTDNINDLELKNICSTIGVDCFFLDNSTFKKKNIMSSDYIYKLMNERSVDYLFIYCDVILKGDLIRSFKNKIINFHPSLLPAYKGLMAIDQALDDGALLLGNSAHFVNAGIDTGPVIMQSIFHSENYRDYNDVLDMQILMIVQIIIWLRDSKIWVENGRVSIKGATYNVGSFMPNIE
jgi:phosphoribosylglycinamide formyltransferase 1